MKNLTYNLVDSLHAGIHHSPTKDMEKLGITWNETIWQSIIDSVWFMGCENVPETLPPYIRELKVDLHNYIGFGLSTKQADKYS